MVDISELQSGEVHLHIDHFHWHWGEYLFLYVPHRNQKDIFVNIPKNGRKLIGWDVILSLRLLRGEWYHKDSCISYTFLLNFWAKNQGCCLYTRSSYCLSCPDFPHGYQANVLHCPSALYFCSNSIIFIWVVGFGNEDNCCQSLGIEKSIKEKLLKGIFKVD